MEQDGKVKEVVPEVQGEAVMEPHHHQHQAELIQVVQVVQVDLQDVVLVVRDNPAPVVAEW